MALIVTCSSFSDATHLNDVLKHLVDYPSELNEILTHITSLPLNGLCSCSTWYQL